jgi:hypothetical protein
LTTAASKKATEQMIDEMIIFPQTQQSLLTRFAALDKGHGVCAM